METLSSKNMPPIEEVIHHQSDNSVKPIIGNKEIEVIESFNFNKKALGFQYIEP
jgi:serine/threonine-protein kinase ULK4